MLDFLVRRILLYFFQQIPLWEQEPEWIMLMFQEMGFLVKRSLARQIFSSCPVRFFIDSPLFLSPMPLITLSLPICEIKFILSSDLYYSSSPIINSSNIASISNKTFYLFLILSGYTQEMKLGRLGSKLKRFLAIYDSQQSKIWKAGVSQWLLVQDLISYYQNWMVCYISWTFCQIQLMAPSMIYNFLWAYFYTYFFTYSYLLPTILITSSNTLFIYSKLASNCFYDSYLRKTKLYLSFYNKPFNLSFQRPTFSIVSLICIAAFFIVTTLWQRWLSSNMHYEQIVQMLHQRQQQVRGQECFQQRGREGYQGMRVRGWGLVVGMYWLRGMGGGQCGWGLSYWYWQ